VKKWICRAFTTSVLVPGVLIAAAFIIAVALAVALMLLGMWIFAFAAEFMRQLIAGAQNAQPPCERALPPEVRVPEGVRYWTRGTDARN